MCSIFSSRGDDRFSAQNHVIAALRNFASTKNVHVTLVIHPRKVCVCVYSFKLLDCSQSPVCRKIVGIEHLPLRAAILVSNGTAPNLGISIKST